MDWLQLFAAWSTEHYIWARILLFVVSWLLAARVVYPRDRHLICLGDRILVGIRIFGFYFLFALPIVFVVLGWI